MRQKENELSKEEFQKMKEENIKENFKINMREYGTNDDEKIKQMMKKFNARYKQLRRNYIELYCRKNGEKFYRETYQYYANIINHDFRIVYKEKRYYPYLLISNELSPSEEFLIELDNIILTDQLSQKKYNSDEINTIIENIRNKYSFERFRLLSVDIDDYNIDKDLNVTLLKPKDRYKNLTNNLKEQKAKVFDKYEY